MGKPQSRKLIAYLPLVFLATFVVVVAPTLFVLWLRESGAVNSMWVALAIGVVVSLAASQVGAVMWKSKAHSDLLFNDLMLWGWVQRFRNERRMAAAADLLGLSVGRPKAILGGQLSSEQKKDLLTQLSSTLESTDPYTHGHSRRVARHAANVAKQMGLSREEVAKIRTAGVMHDVGKVETPTTVLHKAGRLTDEEFDIVKRHPVAGADMVAILGDEELTAIVRHHHERLDGTGYPAGLAGVEIPLGARILAVADTFDAITSTRPYRQANPHKKALGILQTEAGTQLDPDVVRAFFECYSGVKPVVFWAVLINARPRVSASLGQFFSPVTGTNVMATTAAAAAVGAVAVGPGAHTVPASSQPGADSALVASNSPLIASTAPFSRSSAGKATMASVHADPDAKNSGGRPARIGSGTLKTPGSPSGPVSSAERRYIGGDKTTPATPQNLDGAPDRPAGSTSAPAKDRPSDPDGGDALGHMEPDNPEPAKDEQESPSSNPNGQIENNSGNDNGKSRGNGDNGNAYGQSKGNGGNGNGESKGNGGDGNAYGHIEGNGGDGNAYGRSNGKNENGNAGGQVLSNDHGQGNNQSQGGGKGLDKVKEKRA